MEQKKESENLQVGENDRGFEDGLKWWHRRRYLMSLFLFGGYFMSLASRSVLSIAIVAMTNPIKSQNGTMLQPAEYDWDLALQGHILSAFFYGYLSTQILGGMLSTRFGGHLMMAITVGVPALLSLLVPLTAQIGSWAMIVLRFFIGAFSGVLYTSNQEFWGHWAPPHERSILMTLTNMGANVGLICSMFIGGVVTEKFGWPCLFYISGILGICWSLLWFFYASQTPEIDRFINRKELLYIKKHLGEVDSTKAKLVTHPWKAILTSPPVWSHAVVLSISFWGFNIFHNQMPTYLKDILNFDLDNVGYLSALPYFCMCVVLLSSASLADYCLANKIFPVTKIRKLYVITGMGGIALFIIVPIFITNTAGTIACLAAVQASNAIIYAVMIVNPLDLSRENATVIFGISNTIGGIAAIIGPTFTGYMTKNKTIESWHVVFSVTGGLSIFAIIFYSIFGSGKRQPWADGK